ncbi:HupE/UreJ family protein (plasmid) [Lichenicola cladoniae]|uniref:HupE/UreJ family protein n=1 Tax=Lichenicola cladoniae TaxID=1484109 RepID=A0A6M8HYE0_9PROT|nr:HupE/UreJ family protein [Lichenicola cladoniae]NPD69012.1 HupE/UreJ family protein [Acetobacteraceae bacterium]QKE93358.1 HupE/UreJ family protein [Lichenicola cladoniae]
MIRRLLLALLAILACSTRADAHSASSSYLHVVMQNRTMGVQWSIALRDLDYAIGLDADGNGAITWGELRQKQGAVVAYAMSRLSLHADGDICTPGPVTLLADELGDGGYAVLRFVAQCNHRPTQISVRYGLMFDLDPMHRGLLNVMMSGVPHAVALSPGQPEATFNVTPGYGDTIRTFFLTGMHHLLTGIDHMMFVTMLLVPAMFHRRLRSHGLDVVLIPVTRFRSMFLESVKVLSAFTLAHGTTLTLSVLHIVSIPERLSEAGIALTILITALDNIFHLIPGRRWPLAFLFGLVHGLGFATALGPLALPPVALGAALLSFNLGLEAAQVSIALVVLPIGFALRNTRIYPRRIMPGISTAVALVAFAWFTDRTFNLGLMPF